MYKIRFHIKAKPKFNEGMRQLLSITLLALTSCLFHSGNAVAGQICMFEPISCNETDLCVLAVRNDLDDFPWNMEEVFLPFVNEARKRGLNCPQIRQGGAKTVSVKKSDELKFAFNKQPEKSKRKIQTILSGLGLYKSTIDGLYGNETAKALHAYNKEHFDNLDLSKLANVNRLIYDVFNGEPASQLALKEPIPSQNNGEIASKDNNSIGLLDILLLGLGAAAASNGGGEAFIEGFANGMSGSSSGSSQSTPSGSSSYSGSGSCSSDFSCGSGKKCVKKPGQATGVCMTSTNSYGVKTYSAPSTSSILPNNNGGGCRYNTDCPVGFRCDISYRACVK
jgi:peptidoglycan hydrolase-like protein with peptidoglycan-binding domain